MDNMINISQIDVVGLDIDHTIALYKVPYLFKFLFEKISEFLISEKGYDVSLKDNYENYKGFLQRGLVWEISSGNFFTVDEKDCIIRCSHGTRVLSNAEVRNLFGEQKIWKKAGQLREKFDNFEDYRVFDNYFDLPYSVVAARMIDLLDLHDLKPADRPLAYQTAWRDLTAALEFIYAGDNYHNDVSPFYALMKARPSALLRPFPEGVKRWLRQLKRRGKALFVLSSAFAQFGQLSLDFCFGSEWKSLFDVVMVFAKKPGFFYKHRPFKSFDGKCDEQLRPGAMLCGGNVEEFVGFLEKQLGKKDPKVLYVGDSLRSDILPVKCNPTTRRWQTAYLLEEIFSEGHVSGKDQGAAYYWKHLSDWGPVVPSSGQSSKLFYSVAAKHSDTITVNLECLAESLKI